MHVPLHNRTLESNADMLSPLCKCKKNDNECDTSSLSLFGLLLLHFCSSRYSFQPTKAEKEIICVRIFHFVISPNNPWWLSRVPVSKTIQINPLSQALLIAVRISNLVQDVMRSWMADCSKNKSHKTFIAQRNAPTCPRRSLHAKIKHDSGHWALQVQKSCRLPSYSELPAN